MSERESADTDAGQSGRSGVPISALFAMEHTVGAEARAAVVTRVLGEFRKLPERTKSALRAAVNEAITLNAGGFRRGQAGRALEGPYTLLQQPMEGTIRFSDKLAAVVLRAWAESHPQLRAAAAHHLESRGLETGGPDLAENRFCSFWPPKQWETERDTFAESQDQYSPDDAALMLCYVSGRMPFAESADASSDTAASEILTAALAYMRALPPNAPEWLDVIPNFLESVSALLKVKADELKWVATFDSVLQSVKTQFADLLAFFEQDTQSWAAVKVSPQADTAAALRSAERLQSLLAEYQPVHERAASISEERERIRKRDELQPQILETAQEIDRLMSETPGNGPPPTTPPDAPDDGGGAPPETPQQPPAPEPAPTAEQPATPPLADQPAVNPDEYAALQSENHGLHDTVDALRSENRDLRDETELLKMELYDCQEMEDSWRLAYLSAKEGYLEDDADQTPEVESVKAAVDLARQRFKRELKFAPNSESEIESNPFIRAERVWEALQWLATKYYESKMGRLRITNFDQSIKEVCGWWYKGDQGETTMSRYKKSYTAFAYGKTYWLAEHIGKGTNFDARYTIRIAFDWDDNQRQVIIGYIGRHQQTDAS